MGTKGDIEIEDVQSNEALSKYHIQEIALESVERRIFTLHYSVNMDADDLDYISINGLSDGRYLLYNYPYHRQNKLEIFELLDEAIEAVVQIVNLELSSFQLMDFHQKNIGWEITTNEVDIELYGDSEEVYRSSEVAVAENI